MFYECMFEGQSGAGFYQKTVQAYRGHNLGQCHTILSTTCNSIMLFLISVGLIKMSNQKKIYIYFFFNQYVCACVRARVCVRACVCTCV